jgi:hypothetical protein
LQAKSFEKTKNNSVPNKKNIMAKMLVNGTRFAMASIMPKLFGTIFADTICSKSLCSKHLRRNRGREFHLSPYAIRVYVKLAG